MERDIVPITGAAALAENQRQVDAWNAAHPSGGIPIVSTILGAAPTVLGALNPVSIIATQVTGIDPVNKLLGGDVAGAIRDAGKLGAIAGGLPPGLGGNVPSPIDPSAPMARVQMLPDYFAPQAPSPAAAYAGPAAPAALPDYCLPRGKVRMPTDKWLRADYRRGVEDARRNEPGERIISFAAYKKLYRKVLQMSCTDPGGNIRL